MTNIYVAGFYFHRTKVLLVKKTRPNWQAGLMNAIGGRVENGENPAQAMYREFWEETKIKEQNWQLFCCERGPDYIVYFFRCELAPEFDRPVNLSKNDVGEELIWESADYSEWNYIRPMVGNLRWLLPLACDWRKFESVDVVTSDAISTRPSW